MGGRRGRRKGGREGGREGGRKETRWLGRYQRMMFWPKV